MVTLIAEYLTISADEVRQEIDNERVMQESLWGEGDSWEENGSNGSPLQGLLREWLILFRIDEVASEKGAQNT